MEQLELLLTEMLEPLTKSPAGAVAVAQLKQAIADAAKVSEEMQIDWSSVMAEMLPRLVRLLTGQL